MPTPEMHETLESQKRASSKKEEKAYVPVESKSEPKEELPDINKAFEGNKDDERFLNQEMIKKFEESTKNGRDFIAFCDSAKNKQFLFENYDLVIKTSLEIGFDPEKSKADWRGGVNETKVNEAWGGVDNKSILGYVKKELIKSGVSVDDILNSLIVHIKAESKEKEEIPQLKSNGGLEPLGKVEIKDGVVYYNGVKMKGADPESFQPINNHYSKDKNNVFHNGVNYGRIVINSGILKGIDPETFEILLPNEQGIELLKDKNGIYEYSNGLYEYSNGLYEYSNGLYKYVNTIPSSFIKLE